MRRRTVILVGLLGKPHEGISQPAGSCRSVWGGAGYLDAGGLVSYQGDYAATARRAASFIDKILKGTKPGDIPFEQATKLELVVNLKAAKMLGLTIPQSILLRADASIQ